MWAKPRFKFEVPRRMEFDSIFSLMIPFAFFKSPERGITILTHGSWLFILLGGFEKSTLNPAKPEILFRYLFVNCVRMVV